MTSITRRELNRTLLARQFLLDRRNLPAYETIEQLVGLQAQAPISSYVGLWSRLEGFDAEELADLMTSHRTVRLTMMRGTIHLMTDRDALALRPLILPVLEGRYRVGRIEPAQIDEALAYGMEIFAATPSNRADLRRAFEARWPDRDADELSLIVIAIAPVVQVTPRGVWGSNGPANWAPSESWLGKATRTKASLEDLVQRYLIAFGPATVKDVQAWSGLTRLNEVVGRLSLETIRSEDGTILYDVPGAVRAPADTPAPPRFLPEYDNVLLSHADRTRIMPEGRKVPLPPGNGARRGTFLCDGMFSGTWTTRQEKDRAVLAIEPFERLRKRDRDDLTAEGLRLLDFTLPGLEHDVHYVEA